MTIAEAVKAAHADGRHVSDHPDDRAFWRSVCASCRADEARQAAARMIDRA